MENSSQSSVTRQYYELIIQSEDAYRFLQHLRGVNPYPKVARRIADDLAETMGIDM